MKLTALEQKMYEALIWARARLDSLDDADMSNKGVGGGKSSTAYRKVVAAIKAAEKKVRGAP